MPEFAFQSLADSQRAYRVHRSAYDLSDSLATRFGRTGGIASWAGTFRTYGDRLIQHDVEYYAPVTDLEDFVTSLHVALTQTTEEERNEVLGWLVSHSSGYEWLTEQRFLFLAKIRYIADKQAWYHKDENKTSTVYARRHDRRWIEVPQWADGSVDNVYRLSGMPDATGSSLFIAYASYTKVYDVLERFGLAHGPRAWEFFDNGIKTWAGHMAFTALTMLVKSRELQIESARKFKGWQDENEWQQRKAEPEPVATEESATVTE